MRATPLALLATIASLSALPAAAQSGTHAVRVSTPETAVKATQAAL
jgi:hypothetical protein